MIQVDNKDITSGAKDWELGFYLMNTLPDDAKKLLDTMLQTTDFDEQSKTTEAPWLIAKKLEREEACKRGNTVQLLYRRASTRAKLDTTTMMKALSRLSSPTLRLREFYFETPFESDYVLICRSWLKKTAVTPLALEKWKRKYPQLAKWFAVP